MSQVRIDTATHKVLTSLSSEEGKSMSDIILQAVEDYRRKRFLQGLSNDFKALQDDSEGWEAHREEMAAWDRTLQDGLDGE